MKSSTAHRLQGAAFAALALLGAGYAAAAVHDARYDQVFEDTYPVMTIRMNDEAKLMPVYVRSIKDGRAEVSMTIINDRMKDLVILPDAIRVSPINYNTATDPFRAAVARYGVGRYGGFIDCRTGKTDWRNLEAATSYSAPASWTQSFASMKGKPYIPEASPDAVRMICRNIA